MSRLSPLESVGGKEVHLSGHTVFAEEVMARLDEKQITKAEAFQKTGQFVVS